MVRLYNRSETVNLSSIIVFLARSRMNGMTGSDLFDISGCVRYFEVPRKGGIVGYVEFSCLLIMNVSNSLYPAIKQTLKE